jgi:hypothetical protein
LPKPEADEDPAVADAKVLLPTPLLQLRRLAALAFSTFSRACVLSSPWLEIINARCLNVGILVFGLGAIPESSQGQNESLQVENLKE